MIFAPPENEPFYRAALDAAVSAALAAGEMLRQEFHRPGGPRGSVDHAEIDRPAEEVIREKLLAAFPAAYLGEETGAALGEASDHLWVVDPNDGTAAYLKGWRGSAVSIGLLHKELPVLGVVYSYAYPDDRGDLFAWAEGCGPMMRNGRPVSTNLADAVLERRGQMPPPIVFVSQDADRNPAANAACCAPARFAAMPSIAHRLALAAAGDGLAGLSLSRSRAWDFAGGHALLRAAGGLLVDENGKTITYSAGGESTSARCFGGAPAVVAELWRRAWDGVRQRPARLASPFSLVVPERGRAIADPAKLSRAQGCLLGQLAGDSLGGLVEFHSAASIRREFPEGVRELADGGHWNILAGQPTDDSELALMLARSLLQAETYDPAAALDAYLHWFGSAPFDIGNTISMALVGARHEATPRARLEAACHHASIASQANGSLMRISPLGIFAATNPAAAEWARADSRLTHPHAVCQDACAVFVVAIASAIAHGGSPQDCHRAALDEARRSDAATPVCDALAAAADKPPDDFETHQGWTLIALQNAFYRLLHSANLEEGVVETVMCGGDTDTNAAIAGALLGAVHGREAIPRQWLQNILTCRPLPKSGTANDRPIEFWPVDALRLAERLLIAGSQLCRP